MAITLEIVTPESIVYSETVDSVKLPTRSGEIGILPGHIPLLTMIDPGELEVNKGGELTYLAVDTGFAQVYSDKVSILTEAALDVKGIDPEEAAEAVARAQEALEAARHNVDIPPEEMERLESQAKFAMAKEMSKRRRS